MSVAAFPELMIADRRAYDQTMKMNSGNSLALNNLRGIVILIVLAFHAVSAYLGSLPPKPYAFDAPPYLWTAFPIVDAHRWFGFDVLCAWQDIYLMCLMFFVSALFSWKSLEHKGTARFLGDRFMRLGIPYVFGAVIIMPIALYPVYRLSAADPGVGAYLQHLLSLPFWPNGPMWFLFQLLVLTIVAAGVHRFAPGLVVRLAALSAPAEQRPFRYFLLILGASVVAYVPLALLFGPLTWNASGPFSVQLCRPLIYAVSYFAGLAAGALGLERGLLAPAGALVRRWAPWLGGALASYALWIAFAAITMRKDAPSPLFLQVLTDLSFALACTAGWFGVLAVCLRFGAFPSRFLARLSENAFGIYVLHYPFSVWLQYALLSVALFAIAKGAVVFLGSLFFSLAALYLLRLVPFGMLLVGGERGRLPLAGAQDRRTAQASGLSHFVR